MRPVRTRGATTAVVARGFAIGRRRTRLAGVATTVRRRVAHTLVATEVRTWGGAARLRGLVVRPSVVRAWFVRGEVALTCVGELRFAAIRARIGPTASARRSEIGRAPCRERAWLAVAAVRAQR